MQILNQEPIMEMVQYGQILLFVFGSISIISFVITMAANCYSLTGPIAGVLCIASLMAVFITAANAPMIDTGRNRYEVILDDSVSAKEIYEKYKVIEQRGEIWVIEDKEIEDNANS